MSDKKWAELYQQFQYVDSLKAKQQQQIIEAAFTEVLNRAFST